MKKSILLYFGVTILLALNGKQIHAQQDLSNVISADAWIVMDSKTGEILLEKNMNQVDYPASITKILTAIIAIEERDLDELVTVSQHAAATEGSSLMLKEGNQIHLKDLLYGIMLHSGNDGAVAVAEHISQTEEVFAQRMTTFARSKGAKNTNFMNASGLPNSQHYTTVYDMALITRYAMNNPIFKEIVGHKTYKWDEYLWNNDLESHEKEEAKKLGLQWTGEPKIINHNRLLHFYEGATGVKNGFTHEARYTMVGAAQRKETELIAVILRSDNVDTASKDMMNLLDEGFALSVQTEQKELKKNITIREKQSADLSKKQPNKNLSIKRIPFYLIALGIILIVTLLFLIKRMLK